MKEAEELKQFARDRSYLFWDVKDVEAVSVSVIVEKVLNYGNFDDFRELVRILGIDEIAEIFQEQLNSPRCNYRPEIKNYFSLYFKKYTSRSFKY